MAKQKEPIGIDAAMKEVSKLIDAYQHYFWEEAAFNPDGMTDEDIDAIIQSEQDMGEMIASLITAYKVYNERKKIAEKSAKFCTKLTAKILKNIGETERETMDGKAKFYPSYQFQVNMEELPDEFKNYSHGSITSAIKDGKKVPGVEVQDGFWYVRVR